MCNGETCSNQTTRSAFLSRSERNGVQLKTKIGFHILLLPCHSVAKPIPVLTHSHRSLALVPCPSRRMPEQEPLTDADVGRWLHLTDCGYLSWVHA